MRLPVTQPAGYGDELQDLVVLLLHERECGVRRRRCGAAGAVEFRQRKQPACGQVCVGVLIVDGMHCYLALTRSVDRSHQDMPSTQQAENARALKVREQPQPTSPGVWAARCASAKRGAPSPHAAASQEEGGPALSPEYRLLDALALSGALAERGSKSISCGACLLPGRVCG